MENNRLSSVRIGDKVYCKKLSIVEDGFDVGKYYTIKSFFRQHQVEVINNKGYGIMFCWEEEVNNIFNFSNSTKKLTSKLRIFEKHFYTEFREIFKKKSYITFS